MTFLSTEDARARSLETMPVCVRRKLAECGLELEQEQWAGLPLPARRRMLDMRVEAPLERRSFGSLVRWLAGTFLPEALPPRPGSCLAPWREAEPPEGVDVPRSAWDALSVDGRFAVLEAPSGEARHALLSALTSPPLTQ